MKHYLLLPCLFFMLLTGATPSFGQDAQTPVRSTSDSFSDPLPSAEYFPNPMEDPLTNYGLKEPDDFQAKFMNMLFILGLLVGFMFLASWMLKRMTRTRVTQLNQASVIKILETRYLSPRATLYLIDIQDQQLLIAESPTNVSYLASFKSDSNHNVL